MRAEYAGRQYVGIDLHRRRSVIVRQTEQEELWPRPGRIFAVSTGHSLHELAESIDDAFARWDRSHLHEFELPDGRRATEHRYLDEAEPGVADADAFGFQVLLQPVGDLFGEPFLHLGPASEVLDDPGQFGQPQDAPAGQVADVGGAGERQQVVFADRPQRD